MVPEQLLAFVGDVRGESAIQSRTGKTAKFSLGPGSFNSAKGGNSVETGSSYEDRKFFSENVWIGALSSEISM